MYQNNQYSMTPNNYQMYQQNPQDERFVGGFVFPFLLGGVTGAALAPNFWNRPSYGRPCYPPYCYPPVYYPPYRPY